MQIGQKLLVALVAGAAFSNAVMGDVIPSPATDLLSQANGGTGYSSSVGFGGTPDRVNDGNRDGSYFGDNSVAHTAFNDVAGQFMGVTRAPALIDTVDVFNRTDCCGFRIDGTGTTPFTLTLFLLGNPVFTQNYLFAPSIGLTDASGHTASGMVIPVGNVVTDQVQVTQNNIDYMNLAEIEAYAPLPEPASLGLLGFGTVSLLARRRRA